MLRVAVVGFAPRTLRMRRAFVVGMSTNTEEATGATVADSPAAVASQYPFAQVEKKWQAYWEENNTFQTPIRSPDKPKKYVLDMFPYPSGAGLHVGHPEGYTGECLCLHFRPPTIC